MLGFSDLQADIAAELVRRGVQVTVFNQRGVAEIFSMLYQVAAMVEQSNTSDVQATQVTDLALDTVTAAVKGMEAIRETIAETEKRIKRLGEINATRTIVGELRQRLPDTVIVISATTQTGLARARELDFLLGSVSLARLLGEAAPQPPSSARPRRETRHNRASATRGLPPAPARGERPHR